MKKVFPRRVEIDSGGYKRQMKEVEPFRVVQEIIANSFDEDSVKTINVYLQQNNGLVTVKVIDDGDGFIDVQDVYTMYKHSYKRRLKNKLGKFNLGEKQFFILCENGYIKTKNQLIEFTGEQRSEDEIDYPKGTEVYGEFDWSATELKEMLRMLHKLIVKTGKKLYINDTPVRQLEWFKGIADISLWSEIEDDRQVMRRIKSITLVDLYKIKENERPWLYSLGIPIQELKHSIEWHVNVLQKIPLGIERDKVSESWLIDLYAEILNKATDVITKDNAGSKWVTVAMSKSTPESAKFVLENHLGTSQIFVPSTTDYHANEAVLNNGGKLLRDGFFDRETRNHLKEMEILKVSTDVYASSSSERCEPATILPEMIIFEKIVKAIAKDTIKKEIDINFVNSDSSHNAWYGNNSITFNVENLDKNFFKDFTHYGVGLIIHELSHDKEHHEGENVPHYTKEFISELERIGGIIGKNGIAYYFNLEKTWSES